MLYHLIVTLVVVFALMGGWLGLQRWERGRRPDAENGGAEPCDLLAGRVGCHGCLLAGHCTRNGDALDQSLTPTS